ncbi:MULTISPECIES: hypothetical protein [Enterobacterales]|nr:MULTISPECIES: hypothetical protein [Enterobacterales]ELY4881556.1 hypothetical protein [Morganella morganii]HAZ7869380.1 hypothetical protein [Escherichia coli]ELR5094357.1 hypothetical protein [Providencia rettgeri]ELR5280516.1 hypothetical protein [Providencia rettgeri]WAT94345.1 hypothetical protein OS905_00240 [Escherichia sp. J-18004577]
MAIKQIETKGGAYPMSIHTMANSGEPLTLWRIDVRYSAKGRVIRTELEVSESVKNALVRRLESKGYVITVATFTREVGMQIKFADVPALKNEETEKFCHQVAAEYIQNKEIGAKMYTDFCVNNKLFYWETLAIKQRIACLVGKLTPAT